MAEHQPARWGFNGGSTVPKLDQFPRKSRFEKQLVFIPEVDVVGKHQVDVLVVLSRQHRIPSVDFPGEKRHAFVLGRGTVQRNEPKAEEIRSLHQLRHHYPAVVGSEGRVVDVSAIVVLETDEAGVFDAVALRRSGWEKNAFG